VDERFKKAKVGLVPESQFDYTRVMRAVSVLKDLLSEHGHQFSTITPVIRPFLRNRWADFQDQGRADGEGGQDHLRRQLQSEQPDTARGHGELAAHRHPALHHPGRLLAKTFDASKLDEDTERVAMAYRDRGYYLAQTGDAQTHVRDSGGLNWFTLQPSNGKRIDIMIPVEEGERYRLGGITFTGVDASWNLKALRAQFPRRTASGSTPP